jgi:hypothetical protein
VQYGPLSHIKSAFVLAKVASEVRRTIGKTVVGIMGGDVPASPAVLTDDMLTAKLMAGDSGGAIRRDDQRMY